MDTCLVHPIALSRRGVQVLPPVEVVEKQHRLESQIISAQDRGLVRPGAFR